MVPPVVVVDGASRLQVIAPKYGVVVRTPDAATATAEEMTETWAKLEPSRTIGSS